MVCPIFAWFVSGLAGFWVVCDWFVDGLAGLWTGLAGLRVVSSFTANALELHARRHYSKRCF